MTTAAQAPLDVVVLVSGRGSNLRAIAACADAGELPVRIAAVISDRAAAGAPEWARARALATHVLDPAAGAELCHFRLDRARVEAALGKEQAARP